MSSLLRGLGRLSLIGCLISAGLPASAAAATAPNARSRQAEGTGRVTGAARTVKGAPLARYRARIRNATTGQVAGETRTDDRGGFVFTGLNPGSYVVEFVNAEGLVVGTSGSISLSVGAMTVTGLTVTASATAAVAGTAGLVTASAGGGGLFGGHAGILAIGAAAGAGVLGIAAVKKNASPSR